MFGFSSTQFYGIEFHVPGDAGHGAARARQKIASGLLPDAIFN
jgi:hypothetical protein